MGIWGWNAFASPWNVAAAIGVPLVAAAIWGTFRVPNDPGHAPVEVPGLVRLAIELVFFAVAAVLLYAAGRSCRPSSWRGSSCCTMPWATGESSGCCTEVGDERLHLGRHGGPRRHQPQQAHAARR
ncbi:MAG: YrdB family protein [Chloroflexota bacterium]|nr:YrdB family protein [Chloroflexota bacterium]